MRGPVMTMAHTLLASAARTSSVTAHCPVVPIVSAAVLATGASAVARPPVDSARSIAALIATYSMVTASVPPTSARGIDLPGSRNSPATYAAAFQPLYVKKIGTSADHAVAPAAGAGTACATRPMKPAATTVAMPTTMSTASAFVAARLARTPEMLTRVNSARSVSATSVVPVTDTTIGPTRIVANVTCAMAGTRLVRYTANPTAAAAIAPENPAMNEVHPDRKASGSPNASRR